MKRRMVAAFSCSAQVRNITGDPLWQVRKKGCDMCAGAQIAMHKEDVYKRQGVAQEGVRRFKAWLASLGMPLTIKELGIDPKEIPNILDATVPTEDSAINGFMKMDRAAVKEIYESAAE